MSLWVKAAYLSKARQLQGGLVARNAAGLPFLLSPGLEVSFVPPSLEGPRSAVVESVEPLGATDFVVYFEGVDCIDSAQTLAGCFCLAKREDVGDVALSSDGEGLQGYRVVDDLLGDVGVVRGLVTNPSQQLLEVERADGSVFLVPNVAAIVTLIEDDEGVVHTSLPAGIMEL